MEARLRKIIEIVNKEKKVEVTRLSSLLGVSEVLQQLNIHASLNLSQMNWFGLFLFYFLFIFLC